MSVLTIYADSESQANPTQSESQVNAVPQPT